MAGRWLRKFDGEHAWVARASRQTGAALIAGFCSKIVRVHAVREGAAIGMGGKGYEDERRRKQGGRERGLRRAPILVVEADAIVQ